MCDIKGTQDYVDKQRDVVNDKLDRMHLLLSNDGEQAIEGKKHNILVIDDTLADVDAMRMMLDEANIKYEMMVINNGQDALAYLERESQFENMPIPDLIIIDLSLPHLSGGHVLKFLKANPHLSWIPRIVVSEDEEKIQSLIENSENRKSSAIRKPLVKAEFIGALASINPFIFAGLTG